MDSQKIGLERISQVTETKLISLQAPHHLNIWMNLPIFFLQTVQLVLLVQLQTVHHGVRPAFSLNNSSFSHSCASPGIILLSKTRRALLHSPKIGSLFLQTLLLIFSIMNTFLMNTHEMLHTVLQKMEFLQAGNLSPDTPSNHICPFCT